MTKEIKKLVVLSSYLLWGGKAGLRWSESKLKELGEINLSSMVVDETFAIIDDRLAYSTQEKAEQMAKNIGCEGFHIHEFEDKELVYALRKTYN